MAKGTPVNKIVNGEIADADVVNQIIEDVGSQGGSVPYDPDTNEQSVNGSQSLGSTALPWGSLFINRLANLIEIDPNTNTAASSIAWNLLRNFITLKDAPGNGTGSYSGQGGNFLQVNNAETGLQFAIPTTILTFISSGTFVCPAGITTVYLSLAAAGASGSNAGGGHAGDGGNAGEAYVDLPYTVIPGNSYTVSIGTLGGDTTFDLFTVSGGSGRGLGNLGATFNGTTGGQGGDGPFGRGGSAGSSGTGYGTGGGGGNGTTGPGGIGTSGICVLKF